MAHGAELNPNMSGLTPSATVAILPGSWSGQAETDLTARLSYVNFDGPAALASAADVPEHTGLDERWLSRFCNRTLRATERICSWVEAI